MLIPVIRIKPNFRIISYQPWNYELSLYAIY